MAPETVIASFVVRFVKPADGAVARRDRPDGGGLRIVVRQVQSGYERRFARIDDAMEFIRDEIALLE
ncbi:MAG: hypothetical protein QME92_01735 [Bacillota bacterium]|nr:hypothetical protein [Bacillota bacterium]